MLHLGADDLLHARVQMHDLADFDLAPRATQDVFRHDVDRQRCQTLYLRWGGPCQIETFCNRLLYTCHAPNPNGDCHNTFLHLRTAIDMSYPHTPNYAEYTACAFNAQLNRAWHCTRSPERALQQRQSLNLAHALCIVREHMLHQADEMLGQVLRWRVPCANFARKACAQLKIRHTQITMHRKHCIFESIAEPAQNRAV